MSVTLTIRDETALAKLEQEFILELESDLLTVRELIRQRVYREVEDFNTRKPRYFRGLVQPIASETLLNGYGKPATIPLDPEKQYQTAIEAFLNNGFLILVNDRQVECLEESIEINQDTAIVFLRLIPLVGG
jgi:hypothetical protein